MMHGGCRDGGNGTLMIVAVVVAHREYNISSGVENTEMVLEAYVWRNIQFFNGEDINSGGAKMGVYGSGVYFE